MMWDFWSLNPESLYQVTILMSDRGTPDGYRHMNGYSSHTFSMINKDNERIWVQFHFKTAQGIKNFTGPDADAHRGIDPDYAQRDLVEAIDRKDMLQARILSYPDSHRYRLGTNYQQLPVNRCPMGYSNYQRDGAMRYDDNGGSGPNYYPNSFDGPEADPSYKELPVELSGEAADRYDRNEGNDDYTQVGDFVPGGNER